LKYLAKLCMGEIIYRPKKIPPYVPFGAAAMGTTGVPTFQSIPYVTRSIFRRYPTDFWSRRASRGWRGAISLGILSAAWNRSVCPSNSTVIVRFSQFV